MLGYTSNDLNTMMNAVAEAKSFYIKYPSNLMNKAGLVNDLSMAEDFLAGLWAEGYFD